MKTMLFLGALLVCLALPAPGAQAAAATLSARLVTASKDPGATDERLEDVLPLFKDFAFKSFRLDSETDLPLSEGATAKLAKGYTIELTQVEGRNAMVRVILDRRDVVKARLSLKEDKPVIVGGFDDPAGGRIIIVLKLLKPDGP